MKLNEKLNTKLNEKNLMDGNSYYKKKRMLNILVKEKLIHNQNN